MWALLWVSTILCADTVHAQKQRKIVFGSTYTNLRTGWTVDPRFAATVKEDEAAGRDTPQVHAGYGGYFFREGYSAIAMHRSIASKSVPSYSLDLTTNKEGLEVCRDTVEWRTAGGKPFAVIARIEIYGGSAPQDGHITPTNRTGTYLIVRGLRGYERIKANIDATRSDANVRARLIADAGYRRGK